MSGPLPPIGAQVSTIVYGIGGRSETVAGIVVAHRRASVDVKTACHGTIVVPLDKLVA